MDSNTHQSQPLQLNPLIVILAVTASYFITGKLGLLLAIPPGYATFMWPPSGFALAGLYLFGYRYWPGVFLGSLLLNFSNNLVPGDPFWPVLLPALLIASGAALQALAGAWLIKKFMGENNPLEDLRSILILSFLGGFISCLINSTIGVGTLVLLERTPAENFLFNWWNWWIGDVIGVAIFTPILILLFQSPKTVSIKRKVTVTFPLLVIFALSIACFYYASEIEEYSTHEEFIDNTQMISSGIQTDLQRNLSPLLAIEGFFKSSIQVDPDEFENFTSHFYGRFEGLKALYWAPKIEHEDRQAFETNLSNLIEEPLQITHAGPDNKLKSAPAKDLYYPVHYASYQQNFGPVFGYDLSSNPHGQKAMEMSLQQNSTILSAPKSIFFEQKTEKGLMLFHPVYQKGALNKTMAQRQRALQGYAVGVFTISDIVSSYAQEWQNKNIHFRIQDMNAPQGQKVIYSNWPEDIKNSPIEHTVSFDFSGRKWAIEFIYPEDAYIANQKWEPWFILAAGLIFTSFVSIFLLLITGRSDIIEKLVRERTKELTSQKELLLKAEEIAKVGHWHVNIKEDYELYWSDEIYEIHGLDKKTHTPTLETGINAYHPDDREQVVESIQTAIENKGSFEFTLRLLRPDGSIRRVNSFGQCEIDETGEVVGLFGVFKDLTEILETQEKLRESEERYVLATKGSSAAIWDWHIHHNELQWHGDSYKILGRKSNDFLPSSTKEFFRILHPDDRRKLWDAIKNHLQKHIPFETELRIREKEDGYNWFLARGEALWDEMGVAIRMCGSLTNINERKLTEEELKVANQELQERRQEAVKATKAKSEFLAKMSHEIRTPLNGLVGFAELLKQTDLDEYQTHCVNQMHTAGRVLARLVDDILEFSRLEAGSVELERKEFIFEKIIDICRELVQPEVDKKNLSLLIEIEDSVPEIIIGDQYRLQQVILNLLTNAVEFTEQGSIHINAKCTGKNEKDEHILQISIKDTGIGVAVNKQEEIFQSFKQGTNKIANRTFGGTGLGLAVVKQIVEAMEGSIKLDSKIGVGSTFTVTIPVMKGEGDHLHQDKEELLKPAEKTGFILVVEDIPMNQEVTMAMLVQKGHQVQIAENGKEAVNAVQNGRFDLVLMDIQMPEMTGIEATRIIREDLGISHSDLPIIALTAHALPEEVKTCFEAGMDDYITKPVDTLNLYHKIDYWLSEGEEDPFLQAAKGQDKPQLSQDIDLIDEMQLFSFIGFIGKEKMLESVEEMDQEVNFKKDMLLDKNTSPDQISKELHALASMTGNLGMASLSAYCREVMADIKMNNDLSLTDSMEKFFKLYQKSMGELKTHLQND